MPAAISDIFAASFPLLFLEKIKLKIIKTIKRLKIIKEMIASGLIHTPLPSPSRREGELEELLLIGDGGLGCGQ